MTADWSKFDAAVEQHPPTLWWRDDDAMKPSPALDQLIDLAGSVGAPLTLAVIPARATEALARAIEEKPVTVAVHGWAHENRAPPTEKKAEFGAHRPLDTLRGEAARGKAVLDDLFGAQALPLFVPPWNRMAPDLPNALSRAGFDAVSAYAQREPSVDSIVRIDSHVDPIDWRGTRSAVDEQVFVNHVTGLLASKAPIGLMTHHLVHDSEIWKLIQALIVRLTGGGAHWVSAGDLIARHDVKPR